MMKDDYMGETGDMVIANGLSQLYTGARDVDPYSAFDDVLSADGGLSDMEFSEFRSRATRRMSSRLKSKKPTRSRKKSSVGKKVKSAFQKAGSSVRKGVSDWREQRNKEAQSQQELIAQAQKNAPSAEQLNALLAQSSAPVQAEEDTKMSPTLKWGLIIGGVAVAGFVGYLVYKRMKNKAK